MLDHVESDLAVEWVRKSGLDTRSFALITANLGLATLYFAIKTQLLLKVGDLTSTASVSLIVALSATTCSIVLSMTAVLALSYKATEISALFELAEYLRTHPTTAAEAIIHDLTKTRILQLKDADRKNSLKAKLLNASFSFVSVAMLCLVISLLMSTRGPTA